MKQATFHIYQDKKLRWRWRLVHTNTNVLADSGQSYGTRAHAVRSAYRLSELLARSTDNVDVRGAAKV